MTSHQIFGRCVQIQNIKTKGAGEREYLGSYLPPTREDFLASFGSSHFFAAAGPQQPQYSTWTLDSSPGADDKFHDTGDLLKQNVHLL